MPLDVRAMDRRDRGFADAGRADLLRLDQRDVEQRAELLGERRRCTPARRAAAGDYDFSELLCRHEIAPLGTRNVILNRLSRSRFPLLRPCQAFSAGQ